MLFGLESIPLLDPIFLERDFDYLTMMKRLQETGFSVRRKTPPGVQKSHLK